MSDYMSKYAHRHPLQARLSASGASLCRPWHRRAERDWVAKARSEHP